MTTNLTDDISDFTVEHYRDLLKLAKQQYEFKHYTSKRHSLNDILWRHDIDFSLNRALVLARIEAQENVSATYFLNLRSDFYNCMEYTQLKTIDEILSLGHQVGLHFDATENEVTSEEKLENKLILEANIFRSILGVEVKVFSFHNPQAEHLYFDKHMYAGLINTYSRVYRDDYEYCSDSNGYWRHERLYDKLSKAQKKPLQVLTHPGWWLDQKLPPRQRILRAAYGRASCTMRNYDKNLAMHNRESRLGDAQIFRSLGKQLADNELFFDYFITQNNHYLMSTVLRSIFRIQIHVLTEMHAAQSASKLNESYNEDKSFEDLCDFFVNETGVSVGEIVGDCNLSTIFSSLVLNLYQLSQMASYILNLADWGERTEKTQENGLGWFKGVCRK